jgi:tetratricopeptide (TPR) repeat protein
MEKVVWIVLQGSSRGRQSPLLLFWFYITISGIPAQAADAETACPSPFARVVSIQGSVELRRSGANEWAKVARLDTSICPGDRLRTGALSRAALFVQPETLLRIDQNTSVVLSFLPDPKKQTAGETLVEFSQEEVVPASTSNHACGAGYFITRFPRKFNVRTPHLSAAVEGTEFLVANRCETTDLSVIEGRVLASSVDANAFPTQSVTTGQTLTVGSGQAPAIKLLIKPADAVQWTLYYPPITPAGTVAPEDCSLAPEETRGVCLISHGEQFLRAGRVEESQQSINDALAATPNSSDAKALSSIISLVKNEKTDALRLAKEAADASPNSAPAWLALSYAQQADFKLEAALASAQRAAELTPSSALALARVAELQLSLGWTRQAEKTAKQAVAANPSESRAHMILGFVHLAQINVKEANENFERAIEFDSTEPLSRLGLGLAIIRKGNLVEGREQIEIAVALDPTNSLLRSYVGKAYYEENSKERDELASIQFGLAKQLDPQDPTPWFYDAILKQTQNQPILALGELSRSIELNQNRAVFRSKFLLDQDSASRGVSQAHIYLDLGFREEALTEATRALQTDPANASAHRFLAETYNLLPRLELARSSELLQAQMRQPLGIPPLQPQLAADSFGILRGAGPATAGIHEFNQLYVKEGVSVQAAGVGGDLNTYGDQELLSVFTNDIQVAGGHFHYHTDGFRTNNDLSKEMANLFAGARLGERVTFQLEFSSLNQESGDLAIRFDPENFGTQRNTTKSDTVRTGARVQLDPTSDILLSVIYQNRRDYVTFPFGVASVRTTGTKSELQYHTALTQDTLMFGISNFNGEQEENIFDFPIPTTPNHFNAYSYYYAEFPAIHLSTDLGLSYDVLQARDSGEIEQANPKIGLTWRPFNTTLVRFAGFRNLKRRVNNDQGLEPTQVSGFSQLYDDPNGTDSRVLALGVEQRIGPATAVGALAQRRDLYVPLTNVDLSVQIFKWVEKSATAYFYTAVSKSLAIAAEYRYEFFKRPEGFTGTDQFKQVETQEIPIRVTLFPNERLSISVSSTQVWQRGDFFSVEQNSFVHGDSQFNVFDAALTYRFPRRLGTISLQGRNLFDKRFAFQETDPATPRFALERMVLLHANIIF